MIRQAILFGYIINFFNEIPCMVNGMQVEILKRSLMGITTRPKILNIYGEDTYMLNIRYVASENFFYKIDDAKILICVSTCMLRMHLRASKIAKFPGGEPPGPPTAKGGRPPSPINRGRHGPLSGPQNYTCWQFYPSF